MSSAPRRPWLAALLALLCPGLGHLYAGSLAAAVLVQLGGVAVAVANALGLRAGLRPLLATTAAAVAYWLAQAAHAAGTARRRRELPRTFASHPVALIGFFVASLLLGNVVNPRARIAQTLYVPSGAMIPTVGMGEYVAAASGSPGLRRGAIVVHAAPAGAPAREPLLKRVVAVAGDTVELRDGALWLNGAPVPRERLAGPCTYDGRPEGGAWKAEPCLAFSETLEGRTYRTYCTPGLPCGDVAPQTVPAGHVWVAGDHRDHSADSRVYGPVREADLLAEVRWVVFSRGPDGVRWDRVGLELR